MGIMSNIQNIFSIRWTGSGCLSNNFIDTYIFLLFFVFSWIQTQKRCHWSKHCEVVFPSVSPRCDWKIHKDCASSGVTVNIWQKWVSVIFTYLFSIKKNPVQPSHVKCKCSERICITVVVNLISYISVCKLLVVFIAKYTAIQPSLLSFLIIPSLTVSDIITMTVTVKISKQYQLGRDGLPQRGGKEFRTLSHFFAWY